MLFSPKLFTSPKSHLPSALVTGWLVGVSLVAMTSSCWAQSAIGEATLIKNDVNGVRKGASSKLGEGTDVFLNEMIRTGTSSQAGLTFVDNTKVSVAASSQLTLDKFVYNGDHTASNVAFNASRGAFRFISGNSPSGAYKVVTPEASIGVRGTTYDVQVDGKSTIVTLISGAANVCPRQGPVSRCVPLTQACESVILTRNAVNGPLPQSVRTWSFDNSCASPKDFWRPDAPLGNGSNAPAPPSAPPSRTGPCASVIGCL